MKPKQLLPTVLFLLFPTFAHAAIWRVNSSLTTDVSQKLFKSINEANNSASVSASDTLMIEGSAVAYTAFAGTVLTKPLVLIGPGYFLDQNPETQANKFTANIDGLELTSTSTGSVVEGLIINNFLTVTASNTTITRCYLSVPIQLGASGNVGVRRNITNIIITQNYFTGSAVIAGSFLGNLSTALLTNNVIGGAVSLSSSTYQRVFTAVENNIFLNSVTLTTSTFRSNIIANATAILTIVSSDIQDNLVAGTQLSGNGNQTYDPSQLFVGTTGNSTDGQYKLQANSPYKNAGYNNTEPGIFGGLEPYVLSGIPPVPSIYEFTADGIANKQNGLAVRIKAKSNQ